MAAALLALLGAGGGLAAWTSWRERRDAIARRRAMLDNCAGLFDAVKTGIAPDGFPLLSGVFGSRQLQVSLVPDTLTPKRLPQLWLVMHLPGSLAAGLRLAVTARPRGDDFVSAGADMRRQFQVPAWLPTDCAVRGLDGAAGFSMAKLRAPLEAAFADPRLKEIAFGPKGVRLVYQACEGQRGAHLLLRQARFETAIDPAVVRRCGAILRDIEDAACRDMHREAA